MQIKPAHREYIQSAIQQVINRCAVEKYKQNNPAYSNMRIRWDYLEAAKMVTWISEIVYSYAGFSDLDSALITIVGI